MERLSIICHSDENIATIGDKVTGYKIMITNNDDGSSRIFWETGHAFKVVAARDCRKCACMNQYMRKCTGLCTRYGNMEEISFEDIGMESDHDDIKYTPFQEEARKCKSDISKYYNYNE
jgi:hypothetical protein